MSRSVKEVIECVPNVWKSEAAFWSYVKGGIRKGIWSRHPVKIAFIQKHRKRIPNPNPKGKSDTVWGCTCAICGVDKSQNLIEVDHKIDDAARLTKTEHLQRCFELLCLITFDDLQLVCKECHKIKSYADRQGISFEEARIEKQAIEFSKKNVKDQTNILTNTCGYEIIASSAQKRREQYKQWLIKQKEK